MPASPSEHVAFSALSQATAHDWAIIERAEREYRRSRGPGHWLLAMLRCLENEPAIGCRVNLYTHCLQTASRVLQAGEDDELVIVALFHDLAEAFSDNHHGRVAAQMLAPWLSERRSWLLAQHVEFQSFHFANHPTRDRNERAAYAGHPYFDDTARFCELYDQVSFDPDYPTLALERFEPIVRRFFAGPARELPLETRSPPQG